MKTRGFTYIELTFVLLILSTLTLIAVPQFQDTYKDKITERYVQEYVLFLKRIRSSADAYDTWSLVCFEVRAFCPVLGGYRIKSRFLEKRSVKTRQEPANMKDRIDELKILPPQSILQMISKNEIDLELIEYMPVPPLGSLWLESNFSKDLVVYRNGGLGTLRPGSIFLCDHQLERSYQLMISRAGNIRYEQLKKEQSHHCFKT